MESSNKLDSTEKQHKAKWEQKKGEIPSLISAEMVRKLLK